MVLFGRFVLLWSYWVLFFYFWFVRYIESKQASHFMRSIPTTFQVISIQILSKFQVKSQLKNGTSMTPSVLSFLVHVILILWTLFLSAFLIQIPDSIFYGIKIPKRAQQTWPQVFSKPPNSFFHSSFVIHPWIFVHSLCCLWWQNGWFFFLFRGRNIVIFLV